MKMHARLIRFQQLLLTVWVGSLLAIGYLAVPVLFQQLDDRSLAGELAGQLFQWVYRLGLVCGLSLLVIAFILSRQGFFCFIRQWRHQVLLIMLFLVALGLFVLQPQMSVIKLQPEWREQLELMAQFGRLHGIASVMYLVTSILGVLLVVMGIGKGKHIDG